MGNKEAGRFLQLPIIGAFCLLLFMGGGVFYQLYQQRLDEERAMGAYLSRQASDAVGLWLREQVALVSVLARAPQVVRICTSPDNAQARARVEGFLRSVGSDHPEYARFAVTTFGSSQREVAAAGSAGSTRYVFQDETLKDFHCDAPRGGTWARDSDIRAILGGASSYISEAKLGNAVGIQPVVTVSVPILDDGGTLVGGLSVCIRLDFFVKSFRSQMFFGRTGRMEVVDSIGQYVMHSNREPLKVRQELQSALERGETQFTMAHSGGTRLYSVSEVAGGQSPATRWWVLFRRDMSELYADMTIPALEVVGIFLLMFALVAWLMRKITVQARRALTARALHDELALHKRYQLALQQERTVLRSVLDNIQGIVFLRDANARYVTINSQFTAILGFSEEQVVGKTDDDLLPPDLAAFCRESDEATRASQGPYYFEQTLTMPDGGTRDYLFSKEALHTGGGIFSGILGVGIDVTLLKETQRQLSEAKLKAEEASKAKSIFLSTVSHEIRTPMNAIVGFVHLFDRANLSQNQCDYLEKIRMASSSLLDIINNVLDLSKIESGRLEIEHVPFRLSAMMHSLRSLAENAAVTKGLSFIMEVSDDTPDVFWGDPTRVQQVLLNLVNNAVKFTPSGEIRLSVAPEAEQAPHASNLALGFTVADTGIGMSPEQITRVFDPFMQADASTTRKYGGTGLGLSICRELVEIMGGSIRVTSEPGAGSSFYVTLLLDVAPESLAEPDTLPDALGPLPGQASVLLVEDNEINQEIALVLLEGLGLRVDTAEDGVIALEKVRATPYDAILMDMQMPNMDGVECARRMRTLGQEKDSPLAWLATVPIIALTANAMLEDKKTCLDAGMNDHLCKPLDPENLHRVLLRWLSEGTVPKDEVPTAAKD